MTDFPSITFPATFEGAGSIGADFNTVLKFKPADALRVLGDLKALPRGTYDITVVSRQGKLDGDSIDREWSSMELRTDEDAELDFEPTCIGGRCPHFAVATEGELEGAYVCGLDPEAPAKVEHGVTECPLYPQGEAEAVDYDDLTEDEPGEESEDEQAADD